MSEKKPRIPETRVARPNREQRRHPDKLEQPEDAAVSRAGQEEAPPRSQDVTSVRAKNSGHGKKTADKWNQ